jgi:hypothetical protein
MGGQENIIHVALPSRFKDTCQDHDDPTRQIREAWGPLRRQVLLPIIMKHFQTFNALFVYFLHVAKIASLRLRAIITTTKW